MKFVLVTYVNDEFKYINPLAIAYIESYDLEPDLTNLVLNIVENGEPVVIRIKEPIEHFIERLDEACGISEDE